MCYKRFFLFIVDTSELNRTIAVQYGFCHKEYFIIAEVRSDNPSLHSNILIIRVVVFQCVNRCKTGWFKSNDENETAGISVYMNKNRFLTQQWKGNVYQVCFDKVICLVSVAWLTNAKPFINRLQNYKNKRFKFCSSLRPMILLVFIKWPFFILGLWHEFVFLDWPPYL